MRESSLPVYQLDVRGVWEMKGKVGLSFINSDFLDNHQTISKRYKPYVLKKPGDTRRTGNAIFFPLWFPLFMSDASQVAQQTPVCIPGHRVRSTAILGEPWVAELHACGRSLCPANISAWAALECSMSWRASPPTGSTTQALSIVRFALPRTADFSPGFYISPLPLWTQVD